MDAIVCTYAHTENCSLRTNCLLYVLLMLILFFFFFFFFRCKNQIFCNLPNSLFRLPTPVSILISGAVFAVAHFTPGQFPQLFVLGKYLFFVKLIYVKAAE